MYKCFCENVTIRCRSTSNSDPGGTNDSRNATVASALDAWMLPELQRWAKAGGGSSPLEAVAQTVLDAAWVAGELSLGGVAIAWESLVVDWALKLEFRVAHLFYCLGCSQPVYIASPQNPRHVLFNGAFPLASASPHASDSASGSAPASLKLAFRLRLGLDDPEIRRAVSAAAAAAAAQKGRAEPPAVVRKVHGSVHDAARAFLDAEKRAMEERVRAFRVQQEVELERLRSRVSLEETAMLLAVDRARALRDQLANSPSPNAPPAASASASASAPAISQPAALRRMDAASARPAAALAVADHGSNLIRREVVAADDEEEMEALQLVHSLLLEGHDADPLGSSPFDGPSALRDADARGVFDDAAMRDAAERPAEELDPVVRLMDMELDRLQQEKWQLRRDPAAAAAAAAATGNGEPAVAGSMAVRGSGAGSTSAAYEPVARSLPMAIQRPSAISAALTAAPSKARVVEEPEEREKRRHAADSVSAATAASAAADTVPGDDESTSYSPPTQFEQPHLLYARTLQEGNAFYKMYDVPQSVTQRMRGV